MRINNNMSAVITNNQLLGTEDTLANVMEKLSSGFSINHASDNPSGIAIAGKMQAQIEGLAQASKNGSDGISVLQTAEGALNEVTDMIQRMRELSVQAANGTNSISEKKSIQKEIDSLLEEIDRVAETTQFNNINLLNGSLDNRSYAEHATRIQTSNSVPAGLYELTINSAAEQAATQADVAAADVHNSQVVNSYNNTTTDFSVSTPAYTNFKEFIDGMTWTETVTDNTTGAVISTKSGSGLGMSGSIIINGHSVELTQGTSGEGVYELLRDACEVAGAEISSPEGAGTYSINSIKYGADANLKIEFSSISFAQCLGFFSGVTDTTTAAIDHKVGKNADISLTFDDGSGKSMFGKHASYKTDGNHITVTDVGGFEMSFLAEAGYEKDDTQNIDGKIVFNVTDIGSMNLHIGANKNQNMEVRIAAVTTEFMYIDDINVTRVNGAEDAMSYLDGALGYVTSVRSQLGAYENRLEHTTKSLDATEENMTSAISRIQDADMATTMVEYTKLNVLEQAGTSALAQANELPQLALQLLQ